jgi:hypothetical protein
MLAAALVVAPLTVVAAPQTADRSLDGRVFSADLRTPLAGVFVQVTDQDERELLVETVTDDAGRFRVDGLDARTYTIVLLDEQSTPLAAAEVDVARHEQVSLAVPEARPGEAGTAPAQAGGGGGGGGRILAWLSTPVGATVAMVAGAAVVAVTADSLTDDNPEREDLPPVSEAQPQ